MHLQPRRALAGLATVAVAVSLAACGSSSDSSSTASSGGSNTAAKAADGKTKVGVKTIGWVDGVLAGSFQQRQYQAGKAAIAHVGWKLKTVDTKGDPATAASGVSSLVTSGVDAIIMSAVTPSTARAGLLQAKAKGIPVLMVGSAVDDSLDQSLGLTYIGENEEDLTQPLADLMLKSLKPGDEVGMLSTTSLASATRRATALTAALEKGGVKVIRPLETGFDFSAGVKNASTLLNQNPNMKAIVPIFDLWTAASVSAIKSANKTSSVKVYSYYADAVSVPLMRKNPSLILGLADGNMVTSSYVAVDELLKHFTTDSAISASSLDGKLTYTAVTPSTLPPGDQNGPVDPAAEAKPYYSQWDAAYSYGG
ncbi:MAG: sugar ABC transporter substrate-binding protein [Solirubrobacteraceae bacterium]|nr:sugar ABC transporter substrate-binding protein [Patulibacter sp.]